MMDRSLRNLGFKVEYLDTAKGETLKEPLEEYSLLVVLGGYMGAYEENLYPFLSYEFRLMEQALRLNIPILGICLGVQMLAKVLGARVFKGDKGKEIGWMDVFKVGEHEFFQEFPNTLKVSQWHGDTFELPKGAVRVYASGKYENQAFGLFLVLN
jgi:GMP synthase-like glutamine amidotransferase